MTAVVWRTSGCAERCHEAKPLLADGEFFKGLNEKSSKYSDVFAKWFHCLRLILCKTTERVVGRSIIRVPKGSPSGNPDSAPAIMVLEHHWRSGALAPISWDRGCWQLRLPVIHAVSPLVSPGPGAWLRGAPGHRAIGTVVGGGGGEEDGQPPSVHI